MRAEPPPERVCEGRALTNRQAELAPHGSTKIRSECFTKKGETKMQEEVENRTVTLAVTTSKMTASVLKSALSKYLAYQKERAKDKKLAKARDGPVILHGKQKLKELVMQNQGVSSIEITDKNIKDFERVARKYGVDYALKKDSYTKPPRYLVFFKARDADALTAAFKEYTAKTDRKRERPSVLTQLRKLKAKVVSHDKSKERKKEHGAR